MGAGSAGNPGGAVRTYSGFNSSAWSELYFGYSEVKGPLTDLNSQVFNYSGQVGNDFIWQSATPWTFNYFVGSSLVTSSQTVLFKMSFWDYSNSVSLTPSVFTGLSQSIPMPVVLKMDAATLAGWGGGFTVRAASTIARYRRVH